MAQLKITAGKFYLVSKYQCLRVHYLGFNAEGTPIVEIENYSSSTTTPSREAKNVIFSYELPENAVVNSAKVYATLGSPLNGAKVSTINGVSCHNWLDTVSVDVTIEEGSTSVNVPFVFQTNAVYHSVHDQAEADSQVDAWKYPEDDGSPVVSQRFRTYGYDHSSSLSYSDVYLLIDYEDGTEPDTPGEGDSETSSGPTSGEGESAAITTVATEPTGFTVKSEFTCQTNITTIYSDKTHTTQIAEDTSSFLSRLPTTGTEYIKFFYDIPDDAIVTSAKVHATVTSGRYGATVSTINGVSVGSGDVTVDVTIDPAADYVTVPFSYKCNGYSHDHYSDHSGYYSSDKPSYWSTNGLALFTFVFYDHDSVQTYSNVYLEIEYTLPGSYWALADDTVEPSETLDIALNKVIEGNTYTAQAVIGDYASTEGDILLTGAVCGAVLSGEVVCGAVGGTARINVPYDWLNAIPNATTGTGAVIVREYRDGELISETAKPFTLVCPEDIKPVATFGVALPQYIVTSPPSPLIYVQGKCGVLAYWENVSAQYGATIVSTRINVGGYEGEEYNADGAEIKSGPLTEAGEIPITLAVTDSRGRTLTDTQYITVLAYESPSVADFKVWRVNADGVADDRGNQVKFSFLPSASLADGLVNSLKATLTIDGKSETFTVTSGAVNSDWLLPSSAVVLDESLPYAVELTLSDLWESVTVKAATIHPITGTTVVIRPTRKRKRGLIIGDYDTVLEGDWTLAALAFPEAEQQTNFVTVPGRVKGPLDLSTALTGGEPTYGSRPLTATLENSSGTRQERNNLIRRMMNQLHGRRWQIIHPDYPDHYIVGRVALKTEYSDMAHCAVSLTATCEPWLYNKLETEVSYTANGTEKEGVLSNMGGLALIPSVKVTDGSVTLSSEGKSWTLTEGAYNLPELILYPGDTYITYSGDGVISFAYREAVL